MAAFDLSAVLSVAPHLRVVSLPAEGGVALVGECEHFGLPAAEVATVVAALDGLTDVDGVVAAVADRLKPARSLSILQQLCEKGLLRPIEEGARGEQAFLSGLGLGTGPAVALHTVADQPAEASVPGSHKTAEAITTQALQAAGLRIDASAPTVILLLSDYLQPAAQAQTAPILASGRRCFWLKPGGLRPFFGPLFTGDPAQACPSCLRQQLSEQRPVEAFAQQRVPADNAGIPRAELAASLAAAANLAALQLRRILSSSEAAASMGTLWTLEFSRLALSAHAVRRLPQCPTCGDPGWMRRHGEQPVQLGSAPIAFSQDGGLRIESPAESYARCAHLVSEVLGPVTHLTPMPGVTARPELVWSSGYRVRPAQLTPGESFYRRCAGKGTTLEQARMSALSECIERYAGLYRGDEAILQASASELGDAAIDLDQLHLFSAAQRAQGHGVPPSLPPEQRIAWTPAWSLLSGERRYLPLAYCFSEVPLDHGGRYCRPSSNGSAAGNCLEEAILQGLFEAVERDAVAIWWYSRLPRPPVLADGPTAARLAAERDALARLGWSMCALDLTHDLGIPVVVAVGTRRDDDRLALGFGCHSHPDLALRRAVSELHQVVLPPAPLRTPFTGMAASQLPFLFPQDAAPRQAPLKPPASADLRDHVLHLSAHLFSRGLDMWVVDKSRADLPLAVAQVTVPGLRHAWPRLAPGRLYSVPVALGWLPAPLAETELNPAPLLI